MAYIRPLVMVFQEYAKMSVASETTTLNPCIVGPCYHIIDTVEDDILAYSSHMVIGGLTDIEFPYNKPGAEIVEDKVEILITDVVIDLDDSGFVSDGCAQATISFVDVDAFPSDVLVGDLVKVTDTADSDAVLVDKCTVVSINATTFEITTSMALTTTSTTLKVFITRDIDNIELTHDSSELSIDLTAETIDISPLTVTLPSSTVCSVISGNVYIGYFALRTDLVRVLTLAGTDEIKNELGKIIPENPLAFGAMITSANTTTSVKVVGVNSNNTAGYTAAQDLLESAEDIYSIVPLSQETEVLTIFKMHAEQMSLPEVGQWRVCIGSTPLTVNKELADGTLFIRDDASNDPIIIEDSTAAFQADGVLPGDILKLTSGEDSHEYVIDTIIADNMLKVTTNIDVTYVVDSEYSYEVIRELDKTEQATEIEGTSTSFGSSRFVHVWPDICEIDDKEEPGYYLACAVAGMTSGLPSHQGFTRISIAGVGGLKHSGDYFNQTQLDTIANGGTFIFVKLSENAPPYVRHQLTTDMSTIEFKEFSFVKNFDFVSYICKDVLDRFLGKYNANAPSTLAVLDTAVSSVMESLKLYNLPKIGSPVLNYTIESIEQLDDIRDRIEIVVNVHFPYALNVIGLHLVSQ